VKDFDPQASNELEKELAVVYKQASKLDGNRNELMAAADRAASVASRLAQRLNSASFDRASASRLMRAICADAEQISFAGVRSAEQATMALDSVFIAYSKAAGSQPKTRAAIDGLFQQVENPSAYSAPKFAAAMKLVDASLR
jgi:hypothetical protein